MVLKAPKGFEPEWGSAIKFIMILRPGKLGPGIGEIFAARLKEYHNCYNTLECQFINYFREAPKAEKMVLC
jgi:hypothetical protein